jgi:competence protein ComEC
VTLVAVSVAWLLAIASVALWDAPWWLPGLLVAPFAGFFAARRQRRNTMVAAACVPLALFAAWNFAHWRDAAPPDIARYVGTSVTVEGTIASEPDPGQTWTSYDVAVDRIREGNGWLYTDGRVRITAGQYDEYLPGTRVQLTGALKEPPFFPEFDYRSYLARNGVFATISQPEVVVLRGPPRWSMATQVTRLRLALDSGLQHSLPEPEASLGAGIAFGRDGNIPDDLYNDFRDTGLAHIVAVSGSNVSIVAALTFAAFIPLAGRRRAILPAGLTVVAYLFVAGLSASVVRAGIMALVFLFGTFLGRQQSALAALGLSAILMTAIQPQAALGFQLSLAATAGLITFGPWICTALDLHVRRGWLAAFIPGVAVQVVALTLSATLATLPIVWVNFGRMSLVGPAANILVEPLFVVAFWLSALTAVAGAIWSPAGWALGLAAYYPLAFITWFVRAAATGGGAALDVPSANGTTALLAYVILCAAGWPAYRFYAPAVPQSFEHRWLERRVRKLAYAGAGALAVLAALPISLMPLSGPGQIEMTVLDAAEGDAILFTTPGGRHVLVNAGPSGPIVARELGAVLPHWARTLDAVFVTQPQDEHAGGIPAVLDRYDVLRTFDSGLDGGKEAYALYLGKARAASRSTPATGSTSTA